MQYQQKRALCKYFLVLLFYVYNAIPIKLFASFHKYWCIVVVWIVL